MFYWLFKFGDVVEIWWYGILDNDFIFFEFGEYVVYILGKNECGDMEYKYVIVKEKLLCVVCENSILFL